MTTPDEPNKTRTIPLHIADQAVAACEAEIQKLKEENAQLKHKLGRLLGAQQEWTLVEPEHYARLKAEVERLEPELEQRCRELNLSLGQQAIQLGQIGELKAEVERLTKLCQATSPDGFIHIRDINAAKEGKPSV